MKPKTIPDAIAFRVINRITGNHERAYSRASGDQQDFASAEEARSANCHGIFENRKVYAVAKYRVTYELIEGDVK